ncbi:MAG: FliH/SctL family protein [Sedimentibacter sp.]
MSNIIKAEYVVFDNKIRSYIGKKELSETKEIITPKEDLYEIYNQREIILKEAHEEAFKILNAAKRNAQTEIADCKRRGYEEGYNAGMEIGRNKGCEAGYEKGKSKISEELYQQNSLKLNEITNMLQEIESRKENIISKYEKGITKLAIDIAEKIIRYKVEGKDNIVTKLIQSVIKDYRNEKWIKIHISSKDDTKAIMADKDLIDCLNNISSDVKIEVLEELEIASVLVETPEVIVDASVFTQLNNLKEMVLNKNEI